MIFWIDDQASVLESVRAICRELSVECATYFPHEAQEAEYQASLVDSILVYGHLEQYKNNLGMILESSSLKKPLNFLTIKEFILQVMNR